MSAKLASTINDIAQKLAAEIFQNEAEIINGIVNPILSGLGWSLSETQVVKPEFKLSDTPRRVVDYALCYSPGKAAVLIEVKYLGKADKKGEKQLFDYCVRAGVPIAILTDGRTWSFFYPAGQGNYEDRLFARIDLVEDDHHAAARGLARYLNMEDVRSQEAWERATQDYKQAWLEKQAESEFADVWEQLLLEPEPLLLDLFLEEVEKKTRGVKPNPEQAAVFIRRHAVGGEVPPPRTKSRETGQQRHTQPSTTPSPHRKPNPPPQTVKPDKKNTSRQASFTFRGQTQVFRSGNELLGTLFTMFAKMDPYFCAKYSETYLGRKKKYVARTKEELNPERPDLRTALPLPGGWWISTYCSNAQKMQRIREACSLLNLEFGKELVVNLPNA